MIMARPSDLLSIAYSPRARVQLAHVEVTDASRALEQSHLCGPTASLALSEALAGVALLGAELNRPEETLTLRMRVSGPVQGVLVEATQDGCLRGYPNVKVMNDLDVREELESSEAFGDRAEAQIVRSVPGHILSHATLEVRPASVRGAVEQYYDRSLQRRAAAQIVAIAYGGNLNLTRGVLALGMPDTDRAEFDRLAALFHDDTVAQELEACGSLSELGEALGFDDLQFAPNRPLRFACRCSMDRVTSMLEALSVQELSDMARRDRPTEIFCHMCGKGYEVSQERMKQLLEKRKGGKHP